MKIEIDNHVRLWTKPIKGFRHFMDLLRKDKKEDGKEI